MVKKRSVAKKGPKRNRWRRGGPPTRAGTLGSWRHCSTQHVCYKSFTLSVLKSDFFGKYFSLRMLYNVVFAVLVSQLLSVLSTQDIKPISRKKPISSCQKLTNTCKSQIAQVWPHLKRARVVRDQGLGQGFVDWLTKVRLSVSWPKPWCVCVCAGRGTGVLHWPSWLYHWRSATLTIPLCLCTIDHCQQPCIKAEMLYLAIHGWWWCLYDHTWNTASIHHWPLVNGPAPVCTCPCSTSLQQWDV